ncbi:hypothetical protein ACIHCQ_38595 [Streptomyces sp. NPDC052236]|uniref:hypothetical protein n=1 Tax=Streptomyces sp. NPDC052236 TaxID=3365686 RepID=UPI0037D05F27
MTSIVAWTDVEQVAVHDGLTITGRRFRSPRQDKDDREWAVGDRDGAEESI